MGVLNAVIYSVALAAMILVGRSSDRSGERFLHSAVPVLLGAVGLLLAAPLASQPIAAFMALLLAAAGIYGFYPPFWPIPQRRLAGVARAVAVGLINSVGNLGGFVGPYIVGYINTAAGSSLAGLAFLAGSAMTASVLLIVARGLLGGRGAGAAKP